MFKDCHPTKKFSNSSFLLVGGNGGSKGKREVSDERCSSHWCGPEQLCQRL